ncbi:MAG: redox-regulated ATPase YchF [Candidatus Riflebacteria bacterium]|nr:redox-regulated ATPase YchF [Candidatus Riflebacteria bacterium]
MNIGLAGLPMSGKTTIFNMATRASAQLRDYISQSEEINNGVIKVPDSRIDKLTEIFEPRKTIYANVEFTDIPGVAKKEGDSASFSSKTLSNIRICEAIGLVVRLFNDEKIPHVHDRVNPVSDIDEIFLEFVFSDLILVQNKIERLQKDMKAGKKPELLREMELMEKFKSTLEAEKFLSTLSLSSEEDGLCRGFRFLTQKPILVIGNCGDDQLKNLNDENVKNFFSYLEKKGLDGFLISAKTEMEISNLSPEDEATFLKEYGILESGRNKLIREAFKILNYISFFTVGKDEVRAWPLQNGTPAQKAAGKIHSDIERGFIRAEVVAYEDFIKHGSIAAAKTAGTVRLEGKEYPVKDGDIIEFRFAV